jgi:cellulose/xylan binding protein with CBM9 domain
MKSQARMPISRLLCISPALLLPIMHAFGAEPVCQVASPTASFSVPHATRAPELNTDPHSATWANAAAAWIAKDCTHELDYPILKTQVRGFWTDSDLYLLFICPYTVLNLWLPADNSKDRDKLWDRDVVEFFLGDDWKDIKHYREFEIAPTGDWIDLAIDLNKNSYDPKWQSGWQRLGRIDEKMHVWYAAARIPLQSVSAQPVKPGTKWRANLYRIEGLGPDAQRHFMCWQPTCVVNRDPNHVPEHFGTLTFTQ